MCHSCAARLSRRACLGRFWRVRGFFTGGSQSCGWATGVLITSSRKTRGTMPGDEIPFSRRRGAGYVGGAPACAARRVCVGDTAAGIQRLLLGKSQRDGAAGLQSGTAATEFSQARFVALRVMRRIGSCCRLAERVVTSSTACACGGVASACDMRVSNGRARSAPALARTSRNFLIG